MEEAAESIDNLFRRALERRGPTAIAELFRFIERCPGYSIFNLGLAAAQRPGCAAIGSEKRWASVGRRVKPGAIPIVILRPFGPVLFAYELADTEPDPAPQGHLFPDDPLPEPFPTTGELPAGHLDRLISGAAKEHKVEVRVIQLGLLRAGDVRALHTCEEAITSWSERRHRFVVRISSRLMPEGRFATLVHELAHLLCGHLGASRGDWWLDRRDLLSDGQRELEAEAVTSLVCRRAGLETLSADYLVGRVRPGDLLAISYHAVLRAANHIETLFGATHVL